MTFGEFIKERRLALGLSLREFCLRNGHDASNWSKIERGVATPPADDNKLTEWATQLGIEQYSADWYEFFDLAAVKRGALPSSILSNEELVAKLPLFFRTLRGQKPTEQEVRNVIELIRQNG